MIIYKILGPKCSYIRLNVRNVYDKYVWENHFPYINKYNKNTNELLY
jgi:hypothetical protein